MAPSVALVDVVYTGKKGVYGDFVWMIEQPAHKDDFFIFMENVYDMYTTTEGGAGTAALRPWTVQREGDNRIYAGGIPSGWSRAAGGFDEWTPFVKTAIDTAMTRLEFTIKSETRPIKRILYSADKDNPQLIGTGIFADTIHPKVVQYISTKLHQLVGLLESQSSTSEHELHQQEKAMFRLASLYRKNALLAAAVRAKDGQIKELNATIKRLQQSHQRATAQGQIAMAGAAQVASLASQMADAMEKRAPTGTKRARSEGA